MYFLSALAMYVQLMYSSLITIYYGLLLSYFTVGYLYCMLCTHDNGVISLSPDIRHRSMHDKPGACLNLKQI